MNEETRAQIAQLEVQAEKAAQEWLAEKRKTLESDIRAELDANQSAIVQKLLGFSNEWGKWELDHCNGRSGESAAGDWLRAQAKDAIKDWLSEQVGHLPDLSQSAIKSLHEKYQSILRDELEKQLALKAREDAKRAVQELTRITEAQQ